MIPKKTFRWDIAGCVSFVVAIMALGYLILRWMNFSIQASACLSPVVVLGVIWFIFGSEEPQP